MSDAGKLGRTLIDGTGELTRDYVDLWRRSLYGYAQRPAILRSLSCYLCKSAISLLYIVVLIRLLEAR